MPILIDTEAISNLQSPLDIEKFGRRFRTKNGYFSFPDPNLETIDKHLFFLLRNSEEKPFQRRYKYRPDYLSFDEYGTTILWELLMYVNGVFSTMDFDLVKVIVPSLDAIVSILPDLFPESEPDELPVVNW